MINIINIINIKKHILKKNIVREIVHFAETFISIKFDIQFRAQY